MQLQISISAEYTGNNGLYKQAVISNNGKFLFDNIVNELALPKKDEFHCTIMWSDTAIELTDDLKRNDKYIAFCDRVDYLEGHDDLYVVAYISANRLNQRWQEFKDAGCTPTFDSYLPHVTLGSEIVRSAALDENIAEVNRLLAKSPITFTLSEVDAEDLKK